MVLIKKLETGLRGITLSLFSDSELITSEPYPNCFGPDPVLKFVPSTVNILFVDDNSKKIYYTATTNDNGYPFVYIAWTTIKEKEQHVLHIMSEHEFGDAVAYRRNIYCLQKNCNIVHIDLKTNTVNILASPSPILRLNGRIEIIDDKLMIVAGCSPDGKRMSNYLYQISLEEFVFENAVELKFKQQFTHCLVFNGKFMVCKTLFPSPQIEILDTSSGVRVSTFSLPQIMSLYRNDDRFYLFSRSSRCYEFHSKQLSVYQLVNPTSVPIVESDDLFYFDESPSDKISSSSYMTKSELDPIYNQLDSFRQSYDLLSRKLPLELICLVFSFLLPDCKMERFITLLLDEFPNQKSKVEELVSIFGLI